MKVSVVIPYFFPAISYGGPIFASYSLCKQVSKSNIKIEVITTDSNGPKPLKKPLNTFISLENFSVKYCKEELPKYFSSNFIFQLWNDLKQSDVVHVQSMYSYTTAIALLYCFLQNKKTFLSPRGCLARWSFTKRGLLKRLWLFLFIRPFINKVVWHATSEKEKQEILNFFKKSEIKILSDGVEIDSNFKLIDSKWKSKNYIAALGRIHPVKGYDLLIRAMKKISESKEDLQLFIAGNDDGDLSRLKKITSDLNLNNNVQFVGAIHGDNKNQFLANAKCLVVPSHTENFAIVVVEALALETPVIASKNTPWQVLESSKSGRCVNNNPEELGDACIQVLNNLNEFNKNTKLLAHQFEWKNIAIQYEKILRAL